MLRQVGDHPRRVGEDMTRVEFSKLVAAMDVPHSEARSRAQFERLLARMEAEGAQRADKKLRFGKWARMAWAVSTVAVGAGAFRLLVH